ncbi:hypothetical protein ZIOFF_000848 [Zingiber officinale]|uniref:SGNH hydrolase-type esterase domain-containing protein n=1 Tax=Zingiber officinale TaxID=94328 RepID=A0A8J5IIG0_ZINOF|nr:hypothetical protein ZIOFF_000848 [Zingiber officinale]
MRPKIVLFGDSITEGSFGEGGWGAALAHHFARWADVLLRGYSGYNTRWALKVVERAMEGVCPDGSAPPAAVTVFFGANDASLPDRRSGFQHVPLLEYQSNLRALCGFLKERWPRTGIILITPPPIDEEGRLHSTERPCTCPPGLVLHEDETGFAKGGAVAATIGMLLDIMPAVLVTADDLIELHEEEGGLCGLNDRLETNNASGTKPVNGEELILPIDCAPSLGISGTKEITLCAVILSGSSNDGKVKIKKDFNLILTYLWDTGDSSGLPERTNESAGAYAKGCKAVAEELGLPVIDIWSIMQGCPNWEKSCLSDGLHFTPYGNKVLYEEVVKKLRDGGLSIGTLPADLPLFSSIDPNDPLKSFSN